MTIHKANLFGRHLPAALRGIPSYQAMGIRAVNQYTRLIGGTYHLWTNTGEIVEHSTALPQILSYLDAVRAIQHITDERNLFEVIANHIPSPQTIHFYCAITAGGVIVLPIHAQDLIASAQRQCQNVQSVLRAHCLLCADTQLSAHQRLALQIRGSSLVEQYLQTSLP